MGERWILHCDCNSFYASVELLSHPELRDKPVAVCGDPESRHGIILAKNQAAKRFGIQTAETLWQAKRKCPGLILLPSHHDRYRKYCNIINSIYCEYTDLVEPFSIDESWLDVTGSWKLFAPDPRTLANKIRERVKKETGLTISVGLSFNKVFAKLGSDYKKPDATTVITRENYKAILWPLPVSDMLFVGRNAAERLRSAGVRTIGDLAGADPKALETMLGRQGAQLSVYARGEDTAPVRRWGEQEPVKSVGNGMTFKRDLVSREDVLSALTVLCDQVAGRLRAHGLWAGGVQLTIRDTQFKSITRQCRLEMSTHLASELETACQKLLRANWNGQPIRMLTVTAQSLSDQPGPVQQSLFETRAPDEKREKLEKSLDAIRKKYGQSAIGAGSIVKNDLGLGSLSVSGPQEEEAENRASKFKGPK